MEELKVLEFFGGIGAIRKALERQKIPHKVIDYVEIDSFAVKSYNAVFGTNFEPQDISKWDKDLDVDLIMHGSPCFLAGEQVNTIEGFKNIEAIKEGDIVKDFEGNYNKVIATMKNQNNNIYDIKCSAVHNINTTHNHPFYVQRDNNKEWVNAENLKNTDFLCIPINKKQNELNNNTNLDMNANFWYIIGRYIGDGWIVKRKERNNNISGIRICCGKDKLDYFKSKIGNSLHYCVLEDKTTYKLEFHNVELGKFCTQFGVGAINKQIPQWVLDLKVEYLQSLLDGIMDSDGCYTKSTYKITTISRKLAYNVGELVLKLYKIPYHIYKDIRPNKHIIERT